MTLGNDMDQPFQEFPEQRPLEGEVEYAGGVQIGAALTELPLLGKVPVLVFNFARPEGGMYPPRVLVATDDQMAKLIPLITRAVNSSRRAAGK